jgi:hypothetical protein
MYVYMYVCMYVCIYVCVHMLLSFFGEHSDIPPLIPTPHLFFPSVSDYDDDDDDDDDRKSSKLTLKKRLSGPVPFNVFATKVLDGD